MKYSPWSTRTLRKLKFKVANVGRMTVHRVEQCSSSQSLKDRPRLWRPQVIGQDAFKKTFKTTHARKWEDWHRKSKFQSTLFPEWSKRREKKVSDVPGNPWLVQQGFKSVIKGELVCWRLTGIESSFFFSKMKLSPLILSSTNRRVGP